MVCLLNYQNASSSTQILASSYDWDSSTIPRPAFYILLLLILNVMIRILRLNLVFTRVVFSILHDWIFQLFK